MLRRLEVDFGLIVLSLIWVPSTYAAAPFYEGKTIKPIVGFSAGGGFDTYSRVIGRHMGKHLRTD
jgi:tripartite-type tricarboxylate transporter receptor subunit TctC